MKHSLESRAKIAASRKGQINNPKGHPENYRFLKPVRTVFRSSRRPEDKANRLEWARLQNSLSKIVIESREEEIERLVREQEQDARTYQIKHGPEFKDYIPVVRYW